MNKIAYLVMFFAVLSIPMSLGFQEAFAGTAPNETPVGTVTINPTCGVIAGGVLNYPSLNVGQTTSDLDEQIISITNSGNRNVDVIVSASFWTNTISPFQNVMTPDQTHYATTDDTPYLTQTAMVETGVGTTNVVLGLTPQSNVQVYHKVQINLLPAEAGFSLTAQQTETFAFDCP